jgi:very-short-patch-repair endonuclease
MRCPELSVRRRILVQVFIEGILRRQAGVISRAQALSAGMSEDQVDRRLATGRWLTVRPGVYLMADRELSDESRIRAAGLWAGAEATVSGMAAAWWHRLWPDPPSTVEITVPSRRVLRPGQGIRVRRRNLAEGDRVTIRGVCVTDVPLTVLEAAVALGKRGSRLVDSALQRRVRFEALHRAHCRNLGRRGSSAAAKLLAAAADGAASAAEREAITLLRGAHLSGWRQHYMLGGYEVDVAFPDQRVAIEVDGWAWHSDAQTFRKDRQRQNSLVLAGWTVLRFTWHDLIERPGEVIAEIRAALRKAA